MIYGLWDISNLYGSVVIVVFAREKKLNFTKPQAMIRYIGLLISTESTLIFQGNEKKEEESGREGYRGWDDETMARQKFQSFRLNVGLLW